MRFTFDTNVLVYALDSEAGERHRIAVDLVRRANGRDCIITLQALAELFRTLTSRKGMPAPQAAAHIQDWRDAMPIVAADEGCLADAMDAVAGHGWSFWDAMMWATAKRAGCRLLISEDGQDGRILGGVTVINPFAADPSPLLTEALDAAM
ncbi:MAG TPA: PIN domain-containing protein [Stellaceae bacterium]|nr:PIN domain-containing protein [Stellaceae bacterium]